MKKTLISVWVALILAYSAPLILNHSLLVYWGDELEQLIPHMHQFIRWIQTGHFSWWNPSIGLGSSTLVGFFIALGSPFTFIAAFFPDTWLPYLMIWFDLIRYLVIAYFAYRWVSHHVENENARLVGTFILTFSGYIMCWIHYAPFIDPFMGFMMVLAYSEDVLKGMHKLKFSLAILFTVVLNPYYFYMFSWYLVLYIGFRLLQNKNYGLNFIKKAWNIGKFYLLGVGLSSVILIPVALILKSAPRISSIALRDLLPVLDPKSWFAIISAFFSPVVNDYSINLFYNYQAPSVQLAIPHVYPLVIGTFLLFPIFKTKFVGKKELLLFAFFIFSLMGFPIVYKVFNGIMDVRWIFMVIFTLVLVDIQTLEHADQLKPKDWMLNALLLWIVTGIITIISYLNHVYWQEASLILKGHLVFYSLMILLYTRLMIKKSSSKYQLILLVLLILESNVVLFLRMTTQGSPNYVTKDIQLDFDSILTNSTIDTIQSMDKGFYRIDVQDGISTQAAAQDFPGFLMYMSTYNFETQSYYTNRFTPMRKLDYTDSKDLVKTLLGSKYYVYQKGEVPYGYIPIDQHLAMNTLDVGLGFASSNTYSTEQLKSLDTIIQDVSMFTGIYTDQGTQTSNVTLPMLASKSINGGIDYTYHGDGDFIVDFSQSNPYGTCTVDYSNQGTIVKSITKEEYGYASFPIIKEATKVYFYCSFTYNSNDYLPVNVYELTHSQVNHLYDSIKQQDRFTSVVNNRDRITASLTVNSNQSVAFTTVAYDPGWRVWVDNKEVEVLKVNNGFVGFNVSKGVHTIQLNYQPQGLILGASISGISILITVYLMFKERRTTR